MPYYRKTMASPVGRLTLVATDAGLAAVLWENDDPARVRLPDPIEAPSHPILLQAEAELAEYFAGARTRFTLSFDVQGTDFQKKVWAALCEIPYGETRSYGQLAQRVGSPKGSRAVGAANGKNPLSIIAPCHRAIGANGSLTGFAGGLEAKRFLLALEAEQTSLAV